MKGSQAANIKKFDYSCLQLLPVDSSRLLQQLVSLHLLSAAAKQLSAAAKQLSAADKPKKAV